MSSKKKFKKYKLLKIFSNPIIKYGSNVMRFPRLVNSFLYVLRPLYEKKKIPFLYQFRWGLLAAGAGRMPLPDMKASLYSAKAVLDSFEEVLISAKKGKPIVWVEWILNSEICEAFDVTSFNPEILNIFANIRGTKYSSMLIEAAENQGTPVEHCSALKNTIGSYLLKQIPKPTLILGGSHPCDSSVAVYPALEYLTGAPSFVLDVPYWRDEDSYAYYEKYIWELIEFLENHLKRKINWDKLRDVLERVNKINYYLREICEMSRAIPCPANIISLITAWGVREVNVRSPHAVTMTEKMYLAIKKRYEKGKGIIKTEKIRVILWFPEIVHFLHLSYWMEEKFNAVVVVDFIGYVSTVHIDTSSPETMTRDLAISQMHLAMGRQCHGPVELITDELEKIIDEYSADCMFFMGHNGCKHGWGAVKIILDLCKKRKLPTLCLNVDIMDKRHTSENEIKAQVSEFFKSHGWAE